VDRTFVGKTAAGSYGSVAISRDSDFDGGKLAMRMSLLAIAIRHTSLGS